MSAKETLLDIAGAVVVMKIQAGFAQADNFRMLGQLDQALRRDLRFITGVMRVNADGAKDVLKLLGNGQDGVKLGDTGANGDHMADTGVGGTGHDVVHFAFEVGEVQVTVAID